jgi:hypothetical protein
LVTLKNKLEGVKRKKEEEEKGCAEKYFPALPSSCKKKEGLYISNNGKTFFRTM